MVRLGRRTLQGWAHGERFAGFRLTGEEERRLETWAKSGSRGRG